MDLSGALGAQFASILECKICLDAYHKPKLLNCGHTYCQDCLDGILVFRDDGIVELQCPLRCSKKTTLDRHETTSSLMINYPVIDMLNVVSNVDKEKYLCQSTKHGKQSIQYSCTTCSAKICEKCQIIHPCENKSYIDVTFDKKLQEIQPLCTQHNSFAKEVCIDCDNAFLCVYCIHRDHQNHRTKGIAEFGEEAKKWFGSFITSFEETKILMEKLTVKCDQAFKDLKKSRKIFIRELEVRKVKKMEEYFKRLDEESKSLLRRFDEKSEEFRTKIISTGLVDNTKIKEFSEYVKVINSKSSVELVSEKIEIERKLRNLSSFPLTLPNFSSHLRQITDKEFCANPLGEIKISVDDVSTIGVNRNECSILKCMVDKTEEHPNHLQLETKLMAFVKSLKKNENPHGDAKRDFEEKSKRNVEPNNSYTFEVIDKIIKDGDIEKLKSVLIEDPHAVERRDNSGNTLLIKAVRYDKPLIAEVLILAGCDMYAVDENKQNAWKDYLNFQNNLKETALHLASGCGNIECVKLLLSVPHINVNIQSSLKETALHVASWYGNIECVKLLVSVPHVDVNKQNYQGETTLHLASSRGHIECVKLLLSVPHIGVNMRNIFGKTAYDVAKNTTIKHLLKEQR